MTSANVTTLHLTPSTTFPVAIAVTIDAKADLPDPASGTCDETSIYIGKETIWIHQTGSWAIWVPEQPMELDVFGETLYAAPCTTQGIQLVATLKEHADCVGSTRTALGLGVSDSMLQALHEKLKGALEADVATESVSNSLASPGCWLMML